MRDVSLYQRVVLVDTAALVIAALALLLTPLTVFFPAAPAEIAIVVAGVVAVAALNRVAIRQVFEPLHQLSELAASVDPLVPGRRMPIDLADREIRELATSFNAMLERLDNARREGGRTAVRAQEAERRRIARGLHDEISQTLTAVLLEVQAAGRPAGKQRRPGAAPPRCSRGHPLRASRTDACAILRSMTVLLVALAGAVGVLARFGVVQASGSANSDWVVVWINVLGSLALGAVVGAQLTGRAGVALGVGFLGGFTTFSTFTVDVVGALESGQPGRAVALVAVSVGIGFAAATFGWAAAAHLT